MIAVHHSLIGYEADVYSALFLVEVAIKHEKNATLELVTSIKIGFTQLSINLIHCIL